MATVSVFPGLCIVFIPAYKTPCAQFVVEISPLTPEMYGMNEWTQYTKCWKEALSH